MPALLWPCFWLLLSPTIAWSYRHIPFIMLAVLLITLVLVMRQIFTEATP